MRKLVIDCQRGKAEYTTMTPAEESVRLAEIQLTLERIEGEKIRRSKRQLLIALMELREMRENKDVFTDEDIAGKEAEVDSHLTQLGTVR